MTHTTHSNERLAQIAEEWFDETGLYQDFDDPLKSAIIASLTQLLERVECEATLTAQIEECASVIRAMQGGMQKRMAVTMLNIRLDQLKRLTVNDLLVGREIEDRLAELRGGEENG